MACNNLDSSWQLHIKRGGFADLDDQCRTRRQHTQRISVYGVGEVGTVDLVPVALSAKVDIELLAAIAKVKLLDVGEGVGAKATKLG